MVGGVVREVIWEVFGAVFSEVVDEMVEDIDGILFEEIRDQIGREVASLNGMTGKLVTFTGELAEVIFWVGDILLSLEVS